MQSNINIKREVRDMSLIEKSNWNLLNSDIDWVEYKIILVSQLNSIFVFIKIKYFIRGCVLIKESLSIG